MSKCSKDMNSKKSNKSIRFGLAQINVCVGDFESNKNKILDYICKAKEIGIDVLVFPECCLCGYPPEDLLFKKDFLKKNIDILKKLVLKIKDINVVLGFIDTVRNKAYNAAAVISEGKIVGKYYKNILPNYGVFDEKRYFKEGTKKLVCKIKDIYFGLSICEDIWVDDTICEETKNADVIFNLSASPYHLGKTHLRRKIVSKYSNKTTTTILYCNLVGGQDELVFDGNSFIVDAKGNILAEAKQFEEEILVFDYLKTDVKKKFLSNDVVELYISPHIHKDAINHTPMNKGIDITLETPNFASLSQNNSNDCAEVYQALVLGTRDYVLKNGFKKVLIGLSGGIDSAIVAAIAVDALGKDNVICISMPSIYSSEGTKSDAEILAKNLGVEFFCISIENLRNKYNDLFANIFIGMKKDTTEENIQARVRGNILMAMSNKFGALVLTTGNKSEIATGYCTLYGDMAGGFAVIKDVYKTMVFKLSRFRNKLAKYDLIPNSIITRPPSAELKEDQKDEDSLPPYSILDKILEKYIEKDMGGEEIVKSLEFNKNLIERVIKLVDFNEYKRRQAAIGIKITPKSFGRDRRLPITNKFS